jgi:GT2 family glycosyltransferase
MCNIRTISASIVLYNNNIDQLKKVIDSYAPSENRLLYLIDNSSQKTNLEYLLAHNGYIYYFYTGKNKGYGAGHNIAIRIAMKSNTQYHIVLNPDLQFDPLIIDKIGDFMDTDASIAQVMPKIFDPNGNIQYLCKLLPTPFDLIFRRFIPDNIFTKKINEKYILKNSGYDKIINPPCLSGCFMFLRMNTVKEKNVLFDERYFMYCEDFDFIRRLHSVSKTIYYPGVSIIHEHTKKSYKSRKMMIEHIKSAVKYFNKWGWFFDKERNEVNKRILRELNNFKREANN